MLLCWLFLLLMVFILTIVNLCRWCRFFGGSANVYPLLHQHVLSARKVCFVLLFARHASSCRLSSTWPACVRLCPIHHGIFAHMVRICREATSCMSSATRGKKSDEFLLCYAVCRGGKISHCFTLCQSRSEVLAGHCPLQPERVLLFAPAFARDQAPAANQNSSLTSCMPAHCQFALLTSRVLAGVQGLSTRMARATREICIWQKSTKSLRSQRAET